MASRLVADGGFVAIVCYAEQLCAFHIDIAQRWFRRGEEAAARLFSGRDLGIDDRLVIEQASPL